MDDLERLSVYKKILEKKNKDFQKKLATRRANDQEIKTWHDMYDKMTSVEQFMEIDHDHLKDIVAKWVDDSVDIDLLIKQSTFIIKMLKEKENDQSPMSRSLVAKIKVSPQYKSSVGVMSDIFEKEKKQNDDDFKEIEKNPTEDMKKKSNLLKSIINKIDNDGLIEPIDNPQEVELLFALLPESTLSDEEQLRLANYILKSNFELYNKLVKTEEGKDAVENKSTIEETNEETFEEESSKATDASTTQEVIDLEKYMDAYSEEEIATIKQIEDIIERNQSITINDNDKTFFDVAINSGTQWMTDPNYIGYRDQLFQYYFRKAYENLKEQIIVANDFDSVERDQLINYIKEDIARLEETVKIYNDIYGLNKEEPVVHNEKANILFLEDENGVPYVDGDLSELKDNSLIRDAIDTFGKIQRGNNIKRNLIPIDDKLFVYHKFSNNGAIAFAVANLGLDSILVIGVSKLSSQNTRYPEVADGIMKQRIYNSHSQEEIKELRGLLQTQEGQNYLAKKSAEYIDNLKNTNAKGAK